MRAVTINFVETPISRFFLLTLSPKHLSILFSFLVLALTATLLLVAYIYRRRRRQTLRTLRREAVELTTFKVLITRQFFLNNCKKINRLPLVHFFHILTVFLISLDAPLSTHTTFQTLSTTHFLATIHQPLTISLPLNHLHPIYPLHTTSSVHLISLQMNRVFQLLLADLHHRALSIVSHPMMLKLL